MKYIRSLIEVIILIVIDQLTKLWAVSSLKGSPVVLIDGVLELTYTENRGAAFGIMQNGTVFFAVVSLIILGVIGFIIYKMPYEKKYSAFRLILVFIMAGALGNLLDRLFRGFVVDFIYFRLIDFPVFNAADIFITCGTIVLIIYILFFTKDDFFGFLKKKGVKDGE